MNTIVLNLENVELTHQQFHQLCQANQDWQLERTSKGELVIMPPIEAISGNKEADWLINPQQQQVEIYRLNQNVEIVQFPIRLLGKEVLPGFALDLPDS